MDKKGWKGPQHRKTKVLRIIVTVRLEIEVSNNQKANVIRFDSVERSDRGEYLCIAENKVGPPQNLSTTLTIRFGPKISVTRPRVQQAVGYDVILQCEMDAFPAPAIDWVKGDTNMANDDRHVVFHFSKGETRTLSTLKV